MSQLVLTDVASKAEHRARKLQTRMDELEQGALDGDRMKRRLERELVEEREKNERQLMELQRYRIGRTSLQHQPSSVSMDNEALLVAMHTRISNNEALNKEHLGFILILLAKTEDRKDPRTTRNFMAETSRYAFNGKLTNVHDPYKTDPLCLSACNGPVKVGASAFVITLHSMTSMKDNMDMPKLPTR